MTYMNEKNAKSITTTSKGLSNGRAGSGLPTNPVAMALMALAGASVMNSLLSIKSESASFAVSRDTVSGCATRLSGASLSVGTI